jgi:hypothetical protein
MICFKAGRLPAAQTALLTPLPASNSMGYTMRPTVLDVIPFSFDRERFHELTRLDLSAPSGQTAAALIEEAQAAARPKALYKVCYIEDRGRDSVVLEGIRFTSSVLSQNLADVERVFPYVATCGVELDELQSRQEDMLAAYLLDGFKEMTLRAAIEYLERHLKGEYGLGKNLSTMNPGSGNAELWPISQQKPLFALLGDVESSVGVRLTDSCLMTPNKTVSGILFPTDIPFSSCQLCTREDCPRRRAAYAGVTGLAGH